MAMTMVCYLIPLTAAIVHTVLRKNVHSLRGDKHQLWLGMLLAGGALFGVVDHLWNGELFLFSGNLLSDLLLGATITATIVAAWAVIVRLDRPSGEGLPLPT
jgi:sugar phosphate permease